MKNTLIIISTIALFLSFSGYAQEQKTRNRYGMPLYEKKDGSYKVSKPMMEILGDDIPDDLLVPCKIGPAIPAKFTTEAETIEVVYKSFHSQVGHYQETPAGNVFHSRRRMVWRKT